MKKENMDEQVRKEGEVSQCMYVERGKRAERDRGKGAEQFCD